MGCAFWAAIEARMKHEICYAIGDVHGEAERLRQLHSIIRDQHNAKHRNQPMKIIHLGDYVDRGPDSAGVIDTLIELSKDETVSQIALAGNHEEMMLNALSDNSSESYDFWVRNGGEQTLQSYAVRGEDTVPTAHLDWIRELPTTYVDENQRRVFVHAGLRPNEFPNDRREVHLWTRAKDFFDVERWQGTELQGWTVIHGHTPTEDGWPDQIGGESRRINIDTGAVFGGRLTCAVLAPGEAVRYLYA